MKYEFNNFVATTAAKEIKLSDQFASAQKIKNDKPCDFKWEYKKDILLFLSHLKLIISRLFLIYLNSLI